MHKCTNAQMQSIRNHTFVISDGNAYSWGINHDEIISITFDHSDEKMPHKLELANADSITNMITANYYACFYNQRELFVLYQKLRSGDDNDSTEMLGDTINSIKKFKNLQYIANDGILRQFE